jgi:ABC-2 type transport system permease protein
MAYHLSAPISRTAITGTSVWFIIISLAVMYTAVFAVGSVVAEIVQPGELDLLSFFTLTFGFFLLQTAIGGIAFAASCVSNRSSYSLAVGAGVPVLFFVLDLLSGMSSKLDPLKHLTLITLYDSGAIINGDSYGGGLTVLAVIAIGLFAYGLWVFRRRDLPL